MSVVIRGAILLPMVEGPPHYPGDLVISGSRISALGPGAVAPNDAEVLDRPGHYVMPGLVQTHLHLVQTLFRRLAEDLTLLEWLRKRGCRRESADEETSWRPCGLL